MTLSEKFPGDMLPVRVVRLTRGQFAIVDPEDIDRVNALSWQALRERSGVTRTFYAVRQTPGGGKELMHRRLTGWDRTDHINGNGLDNRRGNLRQATPAQNAANRRFPQSNNTSGHLGVTWHRGRGNWIARVGQEHIGCFEHYEDAVDARHAAMQQKFGEFAPPSCCDT